MKVEFDKDKISIELEITLECNINCEGCNRLCNLKKDNKDSYMTIQDIDFIFDDFKNNNIVPYRVVIMGGEPTLHPLVRVFYEYIKAKYCSKVMIHTNGSNNNIIDGLDYYNSNNSNKDRKYEFRNTLISPKEERQELKDFCDNPKNYGISISKIDGQIKYCLCGCGKSILLLLGNKELLGNNIKDIINMDLNYYADNICCHCQACAKHPIFIKDNDKISKCFLVGISKYNFKI